MHSWDVLARHEPRSNHAHSFINEATFLLWRKLSSDARYHEKCQQGNPGHGHSSPGSTRSSPAPHSLGVSFAWAMAILALVKKPKYTRSKGLSDPRGVCGSFRMESSVTCSETGQTFPMTLLTTSLSKYRKHLKFEKLRAHSVRKPSGLTSKKV